MRLRIDYIFHSEGIRVGSAGVIRDGGGDHFPVWAEFGVKGRQRTDDG